MPLKQTNKNLPMDLYPSRHLMYRSSLPLSDPDLQEFPSSKSEFGEISEMGNLPEHLGCLSWLYRHLVELLYQGFMHRKGDWITHARLNSGCKVRSRGSPTWSESIRVSRGGAWASIVLCNSFPGDSNMQPKLQTTGLQLQTLGK